MVRFDAQIRARWSGRCCRIDADRQSRGCIRQSSSIRQRRNGITNIRKSITRANREPNIVISVVVPKELLPVKISTVLLASAVPVKVGVVSLVKLSVFDVPVSSRSVWKEPKAAAKIENLDANVVIPSDNTVQLVVNFNTINMSGVVQTCG